MKDFRNKTVVITGAGSGIGRALALAFAEEGAQLALSDIDAVSLQQTCELLAARRTEVHAKVFDVSDQEVMQAYSQEVIARYQSVEVVINNAGISMSDQPFAEIDLALFERVMAVNFNGVLYGCSAFIPHLLQRPEAALVNVSSIFGLAGIAFSTAYCASKFAVHGLSQALYQEYRNSTLTVHSVHPGGVNTNIARNALGAKTSNEAFHTKFLKRAPADAARTIITGIKAKRHRILIGSEAYTLDLAVRLRPVLGGTLVNTTIRKRLEAAQREQQSE
jgi:NAD(P)-dependent dehydrogenase (short-subunit alcohol dehydrogenase family)